MNTNELAVKIRPEKNSSRTINDAVELYCHKHIKVVVKQLSRPIETRWTDESKGPEWGI